MNKNIPENIDEYIAAFTTDIQKLLRQMRSAIQKAAPQAEEKISYAMPTFFLHGNLVHFASAKNHIGFYPTPSPIVFFKKELAAYSTSKGAIQFPIDKPLPIGLITKIVKFRVNENQKKGIRKSKK